MEQAGFDEEMKKLEKQICPLCDKKVNINDFRDNLSIKEFTISGLCQECQDKIFNETEED